MMIESHESEAQINCGYDKEDATELKNPETTLKSTNNLDNCWISES